VVLGGRRYWKKGIMLTLIPSPHPLLSPPLRRLTVLVTVMDTYQVSYVF